MLNSLNPSQREAVEYIDGPSLVIAGAGSGKTRVLTYKIAYLLQRGMKPWNILALTFTNKAANEMKQRIGQLVGDGNARYLQMGTFHSVFARILRSEAAAIGFTNQFTIYDESDSRSLLKSIIKDMQLDDKIYKPATVHSRISMAKNNIELPDDYARNNYNITRDRDQRIDQMPRIYQTYNMRLRQSNAMDFDDLLLYTYLLFRDHEEIRRKYNEHFQYVLVDEYQDTNAVQQKIVLQIVRDHHRICVVGDDAQSIYGFRGANIDNILDFQKIFSPSETSGATNTSDTQMAVNPQPVRLFKLEQNYRSTQSIVNAANSLIQHNQRQIRKNVFSENAQGEKIQLKYCYSDREEAIIVCKDIRRLKRAEGLRYNDFAILYRTNAQSRTFEEQMRKDGIPYRIYGGLSFYQRKEIKDVIAYFRLVVNPHDEEALRRIINYPTRGIGNTTVDKLVHHAQSLGLSPWDVLIDPAAVQLPVNKGTTSKLLAFAALINDFRQKSIGGFPEEDGSLSPRLDAFELGKMIIQESGISKDIYSGSEPDDISRQENLQELIDSMREFVDAKREESGEDHIYLADFLQEVSLMSDLDSDDNKNNSSEGELPSDDKVVLMTVHSAKGLEFPTVFVVGMEENIFPSPMCCESMRALEEERRLLYVAITRAEKHCIMTSAQNRYRYGRMEFDTPSRFLNDIDPRLIDVQQMRKDDSTNDLPWSKPRPSYGVGGVFSTDGPSRQGRYQNSRPVASQFKADPKPRQAGLFREPSSSQVPSQQTPSTRETYSGRRLSRIPSVPQRQTPVGSSQSVPQASTITAGSRIEHDRFGIGTVLKVEGTGENTKATVEFVHAGTKQLLLKFARFKTL